MILRRTHVGIVLVFMVGWGTALFFVLFSPFLAGDSGDYLRIARNLLAGEGFAIYQGTPTVYRPPAYPFFIAAVQAFAPLPGYVLFAQAVCAGAASVVLFVLGRRLFPERVALAGALLAAAYPHLAFYAGTPLVESLASLLLALALMAAVSVAEGGRLRWAISLGILLGLTALTANRFVLLPVPIMLALALRALPRQRVAVLVFTALGAYAATLAPWAIRNNVTFGMPVLLTVGQQGISLWAAAARLPLYDYSYPKLAASDPLIARWVDLYQEYPETEHTRLAERLQVESDLTRRALETITADPAGYVSSRVQLYPYLWVQPAIYAGNFRDPFRVHNQSLSEMLGRREFIAAAGRVASTTLFVGGLFIGAAAGLWASRRRARELAILYAPIAYVALVQAPIWIEHRYSVLVHPELWLFAAAGWAWLFTGIRSIAARLGRKAALDI